MTIQLKRHHRSRLKRNRKYHFERDLSDKHLSMAINTPRPCSCVMCGNPRRYFGKKTLNELRNVDVFNFDLERMQKAISAPTYRMPDNLSFKEFQEWMENNA